MMNDITVIQKLLFLVSSLASLSCYAYVVRTKKQRMAGVVGQRFFSPLPEIQHWTTFFHSAVHSVNEHYALGAGTAGKRALEGKASPKERLSVAGDWLAPMIVCFLIITMSVAVVGFLLGER